MTTTLSPAEAMLAMQVGDVPDEVVVTGDLNFNPRNNVEPPLALPRELTVRDLFILDGSQLICWPQMLRCRRLYMWNAQQLPIPADTQLFVERELNLRDANVVSLALLQVGPQCDVHIQDCPNLTTLPERLTLARCDITASPNLRQLPTQLHADVVTLWAPLITALPPDFRVTWRLDLSGCAHLCALPIDLAALTVIVDGCTSLTALPPRLSAQFLSLVGCTGLTTWDDPTITALRQLDAHDCRNLRALPPNLHQIEELDVHGCEGLSALPAELHITRWVDVAGTGIRALPPAVTGTEVRWGGVTVPGRIAFHPDTITAAQVLDERNAEVRRVMLERMGIDRFMAEAQPTVRDEDHDPGGPRRLLAVEIANDEPLVALQVRDPSTGRMYLLRVPPAMQSCRQAAAWIAGFDDPDLYQPVMET